MMDTKMDGVKKYRAGWEFRRQIYNTIEVVSCRIVFFGFVA